MKNDIKMKKNIEINYYSRIKGIIHCLKNATSLLDESKILLKNEKYGRSIALAILGLEELAKTEIIYETIARAETLNWPEFWLKFYKHTKKLQIADSFLAQSFYHQTSKEEFERVLETVARFDLNYTKQTCFYIDYTLENGWISPLEVTTKQDSLDFVRLLEISLNAYKEILPTDYNTLLERIKATRKNRFYFKKDTEFEKAVKDTINKIKAKEK